MKRLLSSGIFALLLGLTQALLVCDRAHAALGDDESAVENDRRAVSGVMHKASAHGTYTLYEFAASGGKTIREYASLDGKIFAVTWQSTTPVDLSSVLGSYYEEVSAVSKSARRGSLRKAHDSLQAPNAILERSGHMRDLRGRAYIEALLPEKVSLDEIR